MSEDWRKVSYPCDGCGEPDATETLWLDAPLGLCTVHVHRVRACAEAAREARGGGRFRTDGPPLSRAEKERLALERKAAAGQTREPAG